MEDGAVPKGGSGADDLALARDVPEPGVPGNLAERDGDGHVGQCGQFGVEMIRAGRNLVRKRLVVRRGTADRGDDIGIFQDEPVIWMRRRGDVGKPGPVERGHEEVARAPNAIPGKDPPSSVGTVRRRGKAQNQDTRQRIAESRDGLPPIFLIPIRRALLDRNALAVRAQPGAALARDDGGGDQRQRALALTCW